MTAITMAFCTALCVAGRSREAGEQVTEGYYVYRRAVDDCLTCTNITTSPRQQQHTTVLS